MFGFTACLRRRCRCSYFCMASASSELTKVTLVVVVAFYVVVVVAVFSLRLGAFKCSVNCRRRRWQTRLNAMPKECASDIENAPICSSMMHLKHTHTVAHSHAVAHTDTHAHLIYCECRKFCLVHVAEQTFAASAAI